MQDEGPSDSTLENRERRDAADRLGAAERILANGARNHHTMHDRVGAPVELLIGDRRDGRRGGQPCARGQEAEHQRQDNASSVFAGVA